MKFLTVQEFQSLSEPDKSDYYDALLEERNSSVTAAQLETLAVEFHKIDYMDSRQIAAELKLEAEKLYEADRQYAIERTKKGLLITFVIICAAVLVASAVVVIGMF
jgi:hypothetical protein